MPGPLNAVASMSPSQLREGLDRGEALILLDVREADEREFCAIAAPAGTVDLHAPLSAWEAIGRDVLGRVGAGPVVVYCHHGVRSMYVARWLAACGVADVRNLDGGVDAWSRLVDSSVPRY